MVCPHPALPENPVNQSVKSSKIASQETLFRMVVYDLLVESPVVVGPPSRNRFTFTGGSTVRVQVNGSSKETSEVIEAAALKG